MLETVDQFKAVDLLERWYHKYNHPVIDLVGMVGTGKQQIIEDFIDRIGFEKYQVMYLSHNQADIMNLAEQQYHAYYINGILYDYYKDINFDTLKIINPSSFEVLFKWKKNRKKKINKNYKLIVVLNAELCSMKDINDLIKFGLPIILVSDPLTVAFEKSYLRQHEPNIFIDMILPSLKKDPIMHFIQKILNQEVLPYGNFKSINILKKKDSNIYNFKFSDIIITEHENSAQAINDLYRKKILKNNTNILKNGERLIIAEDSHTSIVNDVEEKIEFFLDRGVTGTVEFVDAHISNRKYIDITFKPDFYDESIPELCVDRFYLNNFKNRSIQFACGNIYKFNYAYAIPVQISQYGRWNDLTIIEEPYDDFNYHRRVLYTSITRAKKSITIIR